MKRAISLKSLRRSVNIFDNTGAEVKTSGYRNPPALHDAGDKGIYRHYAERDLRTAERDQNTLTGRISHGQVDLSELGPNADELLSKAEHIQILACGTSSTSVWFPVTGLNRWQVFRATLKSPEFRYRKSAVRRNSLMITLSQSGETADNRWPASVERAGIFGLFWQFVTCRDLSPVRELIWR